MQAPFSGRNWLSILLICPLERSHMGISCELALKRRRKKERKTHQPSNRRNQVTLGTFSNLRQPASFQWSVRPSVRLWSSVPSWLLLPTRSGDAATLRSEKHPAFGPWVDRVGVTAPSACPTPRKSRGRDVRKPRGMSDPRLERRLTH